MRAIATSEFRASRLPPGRVPVLFTADWCGYCRRFEPHFEKLRAGFAVDVSDDDDPLWDELAIRVVPTVILYENGAPVRRWAGALNALHAEELRDALSSPPPQREG